MKNILNSLRKKFFPRRPQPRQRAYSAAQINRFTQGWVFSPLTEDAELRKSLKALRGRSRELAQNEDFAKKFLEMVKSNVVGPCGIKLQSKATNREGMLDSDTNKKIEAAWEKWGKKENASVEGTMSWRDLQNLFIESVARDGEILVRKVKGYDNPFKFSLQFIEADHLDENYNEELANGNRIVMGVEMDRWRRPVAYHILTQHPGDYSYMSYTQNKLYDRVPAAEIMHRYIRKRPTQTRGVPWMHTAMFKLNMLRGYQEAEVVAARVSACKMGFFISQTGQEYVGDDKDGQDIITEAEGGIFEQLPKGIDFKPFDPQHPSGNFQFFVKSIVRGIASGLNVSYNSLASDLEGVNYSSIRQGTLDERDQWKSLQAWMAEHFCEDVFREWIDMAVLTGQLDIPARDVAKLTQPVWQARGFAWIDPEKDQDANIKAIEKGLKTRTMVLAEQGYDIEDVFSELSKEEELAKKYSLDFSDAAQNPASKETAPAKEESYQQ